MSWCINKVLGLPNINKGHFNQCARGIPINYHLLQFLRSVEVWYRGSCSNKSTGQKVYNKQVVLQRAKFQDTLL